MSELGTANSCWLTVLDARRGCNARLRDAFAHLSSGRFRVIGLNVDVKHPHLEPALLDGLRHAGLLERTLISPRRPRSSTELARSSARASVGISIGGRIARLGRRWSD